MYIKLYIYMCVIVSNVLGMIITPSMFIPIFV